MLGQIFLLVALVGIIHAAFSTYEHLSHLKAIGKPETIPQDVLFFFSLSTSQLISVQIVLEALIGLAFGILGASLRAPPLKEITWASEMKTQFVLRASTSPCLIFHSSLDEMNARTGFATYGNRFAKYLSLSTKESKDL